MKAAWLFRVSLFLLATGCPRRFEPRADELPSGSARTEAIVAYERVMNSPDATPAERAYASEQAARLRAAPALAAGPIIGVVVPLSGPERALGERVLRGALTGAEIFKPATAATTTTGAELRVRDSGAGLSPEQAEALVADLLRDGAAGLIGPPLRGATTDHLRQAAQAAGLPFVDLSPPAADATEDRASGFHLLRKNAARARALARHLGRQRVSTVAILAPQSAYGKAMARAFTDQLQGGPRVVAQLSYPEGQTTFIAPARELQALRPEAVFVPAAAAQLALIVAQLAASSVIATQNVPVGRQGNAHLLTTAEALGERLLRDAGRYLQGAVLAPLSAGALPMESAAAAALWEQYQRQGDEEPSALDALGYDAVRAVRAACPADGGCTAPQVRAALPAVALDGATGPLCFTTGGQRRGPVLLLQVQGDRLRPLPPPPAPAGNDDDAPCRAPQTS